MTKKYTHSKRRQRFAKTTTPKNPRNKLIGLLAGFIVIGAAFMAVLVDLQAVGAEEFRTMGVSQRTATATLEPTRGDILDSTGFVLAASRPTHYLIADPSRVESKAEAAALLAPVVDLSIEQVLADLTGASENDRYELIKRNLNDNEATAVKELIAGSPRILAGVYLEEQDQRTYPAEELALSIVGRVDPDSVGVFGVESQFDEVMRGVAGSAEFERNNFGGSIGLGASQIREAQSGFDVVLTIDHRLQFTTEEILKRHCELQQAAGVSAVVSEPGTGAVLAMASVQRNDEQCSIARYNKPLLDSYEPGSVLKPFVIAAAMDEFSYSASTVLNLPPEIVVGDKEFSDHPERATEDFTVTQVLAKSSNVGTISMAKRLGAEGLYGSLSAFGFGSTTKTGLGGEASGRLRPVSDWYGSDLGSISIGQGIATSLMQINTAYATLANQGKRVQPTLISHLRSPEGADLMPEPIEAQRVISPATAQEVVQGLSEVVVSGTGKRAAVPGVQAAGKTGTSWKVFESAPGKFTYGEAGNRRYTTTFSGFAPASDAALVVSVMVDEPITTQVASTTAAPIFSEIMSYGLSLRPELVAHDFSLEGKVRANAAQAPDAEEISEPDASAVVGQNVSGAGGN